MYNYETKQFFTDLDTSKDEQKEPKKHDDSNDDEGNDDDEDKSLENYSEVPSPTVKRPTKPKKETTKKPVNYHKKKLDPNMNEEEKRQKIREIHAKQFLNFPTNTGISGSVFKSGKIHYSNNVIKETKYVEEIDNQSTSTDVRNFMIGPVFGQHTGAIPCAIIQFINKVDAEGKGDTV